MKVHPLIQSNLRFISTFLVLFPIAFSAEARLEAMHDKDLSAVVGQSMFELSQHNYSGPGNNQFTAERMTFKGRLGLNSNVSQSRLGGYEHTPNPSDQLACKNGLAGCDYIEPAPYTYGCYFDKCTAGGAGFFLGDNKPFGYDLDIGNMSLGYTDKNNKLHYLTLTNPYFEMIFKGDGANKEFVGMRMGVGAEDEGGRVDGYMDMNGSVEMLSGQFMANLSGGALVNFNAYAKNSPMRMRNYLTNLAIPKILQYALMGEGFGSIEGVEYKNVANLYLSFQTHTINYPGKAKHIAPAPPGFWFYASQKEAANSSVNFDIINKYDKY